ncbi:MAG: sigma-54 interaction domain-containing protein [Bacillota bacterium]
MLDLKVVLESVMETAVEGTLIVDENGIIVFINKAYEDLLGMKKEEIIGRHISEVIETTRMPIVLRTGIPEIGEVQFINGKNVIVQRIPIYSDGKIVAGVCKVLFKDKAEIDNIAYKYEIKFNYIENQLANTKYSLDDFITCNSEMLKLKKVIEKVACTNVTILIRGESGVGKELLAHAIQKISPRSSGPFVRLNCAAIPENLLEAELFGYEGGAFTDARRSGKIGKLELANGGTIFLDEIGDMPLSMQAKTLRALQEKEIERVGGIKPIKLDVRIIAATNKNLEEMITRGQFREDLYFRINVVSVYIRPLRERKEDIPLLVEHFLKMIAAENKLPLKRVEAETLSILQSYNWPGNVRELYNTLEKMISLSEGDTLTTNDIPQNILVQHGSSDYITKPLKTFTADIEREKLVSALSLTNGNKKQAAQILGINRSTLYDKLKKYGLYR